MSCAKNKVTVENVSLVLLNGPSVLCVLIVTLNCVWGTPMLMLFCYEAHQCWCHLWPLLIVIWLLFMDTEFSRTKTKPKESSNKFPTCLSILGKIPCLIIVLKNWVISADFVAVPLWLRPSWVWSLPVSEECVQWFSEVHPAEDFWSYHCNAMEC